MTGRAASVIAVAFLGTIALGLWLRWGLVGRLPIGLDFGHLRHAHSHLGYYGVLFPLAWVAWRAARAPVPGSRALVLYAAATVLATVGFIRAGYGPEAIAGSTVIAGVWLWSAWPLRHRMRRLGDPLGAVPLGLAASLACVPPVAIYLDSAPVLAYAFVATFLAGLLLAVVVPSALAATRISAGPWPLLLVSAGAAAAALGVLPTLWTRAGLLVYGLLLVGVARSGALPMHLRAAWLAVAGGLGAIAVGAIPNTAPVAVGAIHVLILSPVLGTLVYCYLPPMHTAAWAIYHFAALLLGGPLVLQGLGAGAWTLTASAVGGSLVVLWWLAVLAGSLAGRMRP